MNQVSSQRRIFLFLSFLLGAGVLSVSAQNSRGTLRGEVHDATGAVISGAQVLAELQGSSVSRSAETDTRGAFRIEGLLPGAYHLSISAKGLAGASADVDVGVSIVRDLNVVLKPLVAPQSV